MWCLSGRTTTVELKIIYDEMRFKVFIRKQKRSAILKEPKFGGLRRVIDLRSMQNIITQQAKIFRNSRPFKVAITLSDWHCSHSLSFITPAFLYSPFLLQCCCYCCCVFLMIRAIFAKVWLSYAADLPAI